MGLPCAVPAASGGIFMGGQMHKRTRLQCNSAAGFEPRPAPRELATARAGGALTRSRTGEPAAHSAPVASNQQTDPDLWGRRQTGCKRLHPHPRPSAALHAAPCAARAELAGLKTPAIDTSGARSVRIAACRGGSTNTGGGGSRTTAHWDGRPRSSHAAAPWPLEPRRQRVQQQHGGQQQEQQRERQRPGQPGQHAAAHADERAAAPRPHAGCPRAAACAAAGHGAGPHGFFNAPPPAGAQPPGG